MHYIQTTDQGNSSWVRYLIGILLIAFMWLIIGSILTVVVAALATAAIGDFSTETLLALMGTPPPELLIPSFITIMVSFVPFFFGVLAVVRFLHNRPARTLVTGQPRINWRRMAFGGALWAALSVGTTLIDILVRPDMYTFQFDLARWLPYTLLALLFIPMQAGAEELLFRGYLPQAVARFSRNPLLLMLPASLLFAALHLGNPEVAVDFWLVAPYYLVFSLYVAWISLKDGTIELALGLHIANNLVASILMTFPESALPAPAPIVKDGLEPILDWVVFIVIATIFYFVTFRKNAFSPLPSLKKIEPAAPEKVISPAMEFSE